MDPTEVPAEMNTHAPTLTPGQERVHAERRRQTEVEQWHPEQDDTYTEGELSRAALAYLTGVVMLWPWDLTFWKWNPTTAPRNIEKAGALYLAEVDRLKRYLATLSEREKEEESNMVAAIELAIAEANGAADFCGHLIDTIVDARYAPQIIV